MQSNFPHPFSVFWWALTLAWAAPIFYLSTQAFTPDLSHALLARTLHMLHLRVSAGTFGFLHSLLRKAAHLTEYSMFALLLYGVPGEQKQVALTATVRGNLHPGGRRLSSDGRISPIVYSRKTRLSPLLRVGHGWGLADDAATLHAETDFPSEIDMALDLIC
jgi:hypothetical protein